MSELEPPSESRDDQASESQHQDAEDSRTSTGQRRINLIWELTQASIALMLMGGIVYMSIRQIPVPDELKILASLIGGAYFSRTNHERIGGVGIKYEGR
jgi:hypothetical protein